MALFANRTVSLKNFNNYTKSLKLFTSLQNVNSLKFIHYNQASSSQKKYGSNTVQSLRNYAAKTSFFGMFTKGRNQSELNLAALSTLNEIYMKVFLMIY